MTPCAHSAVYWTTQIRDGHVHGWWECSSCRMHVPLKLPESPIDKLKKAVDSVLDYESHFNCKENKLKVCVNALVNLRNARTTFNKGG